ncbi:MAG: FG-GAP-like repeat-containing protein [Candidatus Contendobacter sp.]|nr:FG-GAP-like repeat-containing protein [Candidatus Contendobacter sp.]
MNLVARWLVAIALVLGSASSWAQISYFTLIDTDNNAATGCTVTLPTAGSVTGIERRLTATISETASPQVTQLSLESCVGSSFGAPVALPGTPYPVGLNNGVGGADVIEQAAPADAVAPPGPSVRLYFAAQGRTSDDLLGSAGGGAPILFDLWPTGGSVGIPTLSEWGLLGLILLLLVAVIRQRSRLPGSMVAVLLVGMLTGIVWAAGFLLDGQVNDWQGVSAVGTDAAGDSTSNTTDILAAFAAREGGNAFFRIDVTNAQTPNHAPSFTKGADPTVLEDAGARTVAGWATAIDDGDPGSVQVLTFQITNNTNPGLFSAGPAVDATTGNLTYTPAANANGTATITLTLSDDGSNTSPNVNTSAPQTFVITVNAVNDAPSFTKGANQTVLDNAGAQTVPGWATAISAGPADEASQTLTFNVSNDNNPLFLVQPAISATGDLTYDPTANASGGTATITVTLSDNGSGVAPNVNTSAAQTFTITVTAVDDPPTAVDDPATVAEDAPATAIDVLANDTDPDGGPKTIASVTQPANGTVVITGGGTGLTYQPNPNYCNTSPDTFTYTLAPGGSTANVTVTVTCVDDNPVAVADTPTVSEDSGAAAIDVLGNDTDPDGGAKLVNSVTQPANGTVVITGGGTGLTYQPNPNYCNSPPGTTLDTFDYTLTPGGSNATVSVTVTCLNDPPVLTLPASIAVTEDVPTSLTGISAADPDAGGGNVTMTLSVPLGTLAATSGGGVTASGSSSSYTLTGALADLNAFIVAGLVTYQFDGVGLPVLATGTQPYAVAIGDLDGDGQPDLVTANRGANSVSVLRNTTTSSLSFAAKTDFAVGPFPSAVAIGDLDGDGKPDLVVANSNGNTGGPSTVSILINTSTPGNLSFQPQATFAVGANPSDIALGDLDGDGKLDVIVANANIQSSNPIQTVSVRRNTSTVGALSLAAEQTFNVGSKPGALALGDLDGDGKLDVAVANSDNISNVNVMPDTVSVLRNAGSVGAIAFDAQVTFPTDDIPGSVAIGDIDGDGKAELVVGNTNSNNVSVYRNTSSGVGNVNFAAKIDFSTGSGLKAVRLGDLNGDGKLDVAAPSSNESKLSVYLNTSTIGAISLAARTDFPVSTNPSGSNPFDLVLGDLDGDSKLDLATANLTDNAVTVFKNLCAPGCSPIVLANIASSVILDVAVNDNGNTGAGGPLGASGAVALNISLVNDAPVLTVPSSIAVVEDTPSPLTGISVSDVDAGAGNIQVTFATPVGTQLTATSGGGVTVGGPNAHTRVLTGSVANINAFIAAGNVRFGTAPNDTAPVTLTVTANDQGRTGSGGALSDSETTTLTVTGANDDPVIALPGPTAAYGGTPAILDATATVSDIDSPNFDTGVLAANVTTDCENDDRIGVHDQGAGVGNISVSGLTVRYDFGSGPVAIGTIATEFNCATPAVPTLAITLNATADLTATQALLRNLTYFSASTPTGTSRVVEVVLTDGDGGTSNTATKTINIDAAPSVFSIVPTNNATAVAINNNVVVAFSEAVNATASAFSLECPVGTPVTFIAAPLLPASNATVIQLDPSSDLPNGVTCTVRVNKDEITDFDSNDPPDNMTTDFTSTFTTVDIAPRVTSTTPVASAKVGTGQTVTLNFSESVDIAAGGITWNCGGAVAFSPALPQTGVSSLTLTPSSALPEGATCTVTLESTLITDVDSVDPPNQLDGNGDNDTTDGDADDFTLGFTVDTAPTFVSSTPADGNVNVNVSSNIGVGFSEAVTVSSPASFTINCGASVPYSVAAGNGTNFIALDPSANLPGGTICTVTINGGSVSDIDTADPPNVMATSPSFSFTTQSIANDDSYNVTPHLTLNVDTGIQGGRVTANDQIGGGSITGFGFTGSCNATAPNGTNAVITSGGGRVVLAADGSFGYIPPAGASNTTDSFCYTVTGGDTATVTFNLANTELVWFVDAVYGGANGAANGTQGRPFTTLTAAVGVDTPSDTIFVKHNAGGYTCGISLLSNEKLIGEGSGSTLAALSGVTPVTGSAFPGLTNSSAQWPTLTANNADCVTLSTGNTIRGFNFGNVGALSNVNNALVGSGFGTLTVNDAAIATNGAALNLSNGTFNATLGSVSSSGGQLNNVRLVTVAGTVDLGNSGTLTGALSGVAFVVNGGTVAITYGGSITAANPVDIQSHSVGNITLSGALSSTSGNPGINIANNTSGTITLSGASKVVTSAANPAVVLSNNTGTTINFTGGGLAINTTGGTGFSATGGGTVNVTGSGNTITSGSGTALNVANTNIGASGLTFQSIASNGGSNTGIILDTTGFSGGLTVTGTGSAGSGGTVANKAGANGSVVTGVGVYLNNTGPVSLSRMQMNDFQNFAILGNIVASFVLRDSVINGVSGTLGAGNAGTNPTSRESVIFITDLSGTSGILNSTISGGATDNIRFIKNSGTLNLTITGNTIQNNDNTNGGIGEDGLFISTEGGSSLFANIANNTFANHHGDHVSASGNGTSQLHVTINNNGMTADGGVTEDFDNNGTFGDDLGGTILVADNESADVFFDVSNNTIFGAVLTAIAINQSAFTTAAASLSGRVQNNTIGNAAITDSGSAQGSGIAIDAQGASAGAGLYKIIISAADNDVFEYNNHGILLASGDGSSALAATVTSNIINNPGTFGANGIHLNHGKTSTPAGGGGADSQTGCFDIRTNNIVGAGNAGAGSTDFRLRQRINTTVQLVGYTGSASDTAAVIAYVQGLNTGAETGQATVSGTGGGFINTPSGVNCPSPTLPTLPSAP